MADVVTAGQGPARRGGARAAAPDREVLYRFRGGDPDALGELYRRYCSPVWGIAMGVLHDRQLAEDAVTETFLRAWRSAASFDPARPVAPWLFTLARRAALDLLRKELRPTQGGHAPEQDAVVEPFDVGAAWEAWAVRAAVDELSGEEQAVVRLSHFAGLTHPQIAAQLGVPVGTVKSRSYRAHRHLAARLQHLRATSEEAR